VELGLKTYARLLSSQIRVLGLLERYREAIRVYKENWAWENYIPPPEMAAILYEAGRIYERCGCGVKAMEKLEEAYEAIRKRKIRDVKQRKLLHDITTQLIVKFIEMKKYDEAVKCAKDFGSGIIRTLLSLKFKNKSLKSKIEALIMDIKPCLRRSKERKNLRTIN